MPGTGLPLSSLAASDSRTLAESVNDPGAARGSGDPAKLSTVVKAYSLYTADSKEGSAVR